jgi:hypothetical protein
VVAFLEEQYTSLLTALFGISRQKWECVMKRKKKGGGKELLYPSQPSKVSKCRRARLSTGICEVGR